MAPLAPDDAQKIAQVVEYLRQSKSLLFITGAGLSADSGLPTYRGVSGLYNHNDTEENMPIEALLSKQVMQVRPDLTWKYLSQVEQACRGAKPNRGHEVIAEFEKRFERVWVLTQNVDGFHREAGSKNVIDIHGDLHFIRCTKCTFRDEVRDYRTYTFPPKCMKCGAVLRPEVVLFGEALPDRQMELYDRETRRGFDVVFSIGTTSVFPYISAPMLDAYHLKKPSVEINPGTTDVSEFATVQLPMGAAAALDAIWSEFNR
jgi:NAD-dependent deacetylase